MESFKTNVRKAHNGLCLVVIRSTEQSGTVTVKAVSEGLIADVLDIRTQ
jgi:beta-galactosidase